MYKTIVANYKMIELNLKDIVFTADFSPIKMGQTVKEVIKILGDPVNSSDDGNGSILFSYGGYELYFFDDKLHYFQNDNLKNDKRNHLDCISFQNDNFKFHSGFVIPNKDISLREVISLLENEKIDFSIENQKVAGKDYRVGEIKNLVLSNGIFMNFENKTTKFIQADDQEIIKSKELFFDDEMDFVLFAVRYEHWSIQEN